jgi:hypothetical protein
VSSLHGPLQSKCPRHGWKRWQSVPKEYEHAN